MTPRRATSLPQPIKTLDSRCDRYGRLPERDVALLWLTHTTGTLAVQAVKSPMKPANGRPHRVNSHKYLDLRVDIGLGHRNENEQKK